MARSNKEYYWKNRERESARKKAFWAQLTPEEKERRLTKQRAWNKANRDRRYAASLRREYGITLEDFNRMYEAQDRACALCRRATPARDIVVDHNHITEIVRGLLCMRCNLGLGFFDDNPLKLSIAISYLRRRKTKGLER